MQAIGQGQAGCVVGAAVNARTGGELRQGVLQAHLGLVQIVLCVDC